MCTGVSAGVKVFKLRFFILKSESRLAGVHGQLFDFFVVPLLMANTALHFSLLLLLLLLLLCSTQPNSQMASTKGEEGGGGGFHCQTTTKRSKRHECEECGLAESSDCHLDLYGGAHCTSRPCSGALPTTMKTFRNPSQAFYTKSPSRQAHGPSGCVCRGRW